MSDESNHSYYTEQREELPNFGVETVRRCVCGHRLPWFGSEAAHDRHQEQMREKSSG